MPTNYVFQPKINFLEMAHTNFVSSLRITPYQPLICIIIAKTCFLIKKKTDFRTLHQYFLFIIYVYQFLEDLSIHISLYTLRATQPNQLGVGVLLQCHGAASGYWAGGRDVGIVTAARDHSANEHHRHDNDRPRNVTSACASDFI